MSVRALLAVKFKHKPTVAILIGTYILVERLEHSCSGKTLAAFHYHMTFKRRYMYIHVQCTVHVCV